MNQQEFKINIHFKELEEIYTYIKLQDPSASDSIKHDLFKLIANLGLITFGIKFNMSEEYQSIRNNKVMQETFISLVPNNCLEFYVNVAGPTDISLIISDRHLHDQSRILFANTSSNTMEVCNAILSASEYLDANYKNWREEIFYGTSEYV